MRRRPLTLLVALSTALGAGCGGGSDGPQVIAAPQTLVFDAMPGPLLAGTGTTVRAVASSGLPVRYGSATPATCTVDAATGQVLALAAGTCTVLADQPGNADWAPAPQRALDLGVAADRLQTLAFDPAPALTLGGTATVRAMASSGLPVRYGSATDAVCRVDPVTGLVSALGPGACRLTADQAGDADHDPAAQATLAIEVEVPPGLTVPQAPAGLSATLGSDRFRVVLSVGSVDAGGSPVTGYTVESVPPGVVVQSAAAPVAIACPAGCGGLAFTVRAHNVLGAGPASAPVEVLTAFDVTAVFREPDTQPRDTVFIGSFTLNSTTGEVTGLAGELTESMTGNAVGVPPLYDMTRVPLTHPLLSWRDATLGGRFAASFAREVTTTFTALAGGDGWSPAAGVANGGLYAGFPAPYAGTVRNSYVLLFIPDDPFAPLTPAQVDRLAYADCAPGGMMGAVCMTATSVAGHGAVGTMSGYPLSQTITRR